MTLTRGMFQNPVAQTFLSAIGNLIQPTRLLLSVMLQTDRQSFRSPLNIKVTSRIVKPLLREFPLDRIVKEINQFLFQLGLVANNSVERFRLPNRALGAAGEIDLAGARPFLSPS